jgi:flagellar hook-associated protein 3 FlgL
MARAQEELSTGKQINRPSDDPIGYSKVMGYRPAMQFYKQASSQIDMAIMMQTAADDALVEIQQLILEVRDIATTELQGIEDPVRTRTNLRHLEEILGSMVDIANVSVAGKYLFGGFKSQYPPYVNSVHSEQSEEGYPQFVGGVTYLGDGNHYELEILPGVYSQIGAPGSEVLGGEAFNEGVNLFYIIQDLMNFISYPDRRATGGAAVSNKERIKNATLYLNTAYNQIAGYRANIGAGVQTLEGAKSWLEDLYESTNEMRDFTENGDVLVQDPLKLEQAKRSLETTFASLNTVLQPSVIKLAQASS